MKTDKKKLKGVHNGSAYFEFLKIKDQLRLTPEEEKNILPLKRIYEDNNRKAYYVCRNRI